MIFILYFSKLILLVSTEMIAKSTTHTQTGLPMKFERQLQTNPKLVIDLHVMNFSTGLVNFDRICLHTVRES